MKDISIFLGANTARGFRSLYEEYIGSLDLRRLYVIKGSAGCGKSGLMKRVSERAAGMGLGCVRVLCSGDPDSLDGVLIPERGIAFFDGTSPHVLEPALTGQQGFYLDLSRFYTSPAMGLETPDAAYRALKDEVLADTSDHRLQGLTDFVFGADADKLTKRITDIRGTYLCVEFSTVNSTIDPQVDVKTDLIRVGVTVATPHPDNYDLVATAIDQDKTLAQCGVVDNDILDINLAGKAGSI